MDQSGHQKGEERDIAVNIGEGGGMWALDRQTGQFAGQSIPLCRTELPDLRYLRENRPYHH